MTIILKPNWIDTKKTNLYNEKSDVSKVTSGLFVNLFQ